MPLSSGRRGPRAFIAEEGQAVAFVALLLTSLFGFVGLVVDVGWFQLNLVRIQRAADAGALAGSVYLPGNLPGAQTAALAATAQNSYTNAVGGVTVTAAQDSVNTQMLNVSVTAPVRTWFMRLFGVNTITANRNARAEFILPVAMGSPQAWYGVSKLCDDAGTCVVPPSADGIGSITSGGFWGGVITKGGNHKNGDAYSTYYNPNPTLNAEYDPNGYSYIIDLPTGVSGGTVWIYDPIFCATGHGASGSYLGTGDHWIGTGGTGVTTEFKLWDMNGTPYSTTDDILIATDLGLFTNMNNVDKGGSYGGDSRYSDGGYNGGSSADCEASPYHNTWWPLKTGLAAGQYRLQVTTSSANNNATSAENVFAIQATWTSGTGGHVYGQSRMCAYVNLPSAGASLFYLAQVPAVHAGKTLEIKLFDPGDTNNTTLRIKQPTAAGYVDATFNFTAQGGTGPSSGTNLTSLITSNGSGNLYDNAWVTIDIALPTNYNAPTPPGEPGPGWWKIEYTVGAPGNDTTTWSVNIRGNPVHLVTP